MTRDEVLGILAHPEEARAWAEGKDIERATITGWVLDIRPSFFPNSDYRVKPEVHTATRWVNIYVYGPSPMLNVSEEEAINNTSPSYKLLDRVQVTITWTEGEGLDD